MSINASDLYDRLATLAGEMEDGALMGRAVVVFEVSNVDDSRRVAIATCDPSGHELWPWDTAGLLRWAEDGFAVDFDDEVTDDDEDGGA